jgi:hypothetical protein
MFGAEATGQIVAITVPVAGATHDWMDKVWGWSQFGGAILALAALAFAAWGVLQAKSASAAAERTATAAEETAKLARQELGIIIEQISKRPELQLVPTIHHLPHTRAIVLQLGFSNGGRAEARETIVNIIFPVDGNIYETHGPSADYKAPVEVRDTPEDIDGTGRGASYGIAKVDVRPQIAVVRYFRIGFADAGTHAIRISVVHPDAEPLSVPLSVKVS